MRPEVAQGTDRAIIKEPVWTWEIPLYFYVSKHLVKPQVQGWYDNVMNVVYSRDLSLTKPAN